MSGCPKCHGEICEQSCNECDCGNVYTHWQNDLINRQVGIIEGLQAHVKELEYQLEIRDETLRRERDEKYAPEMELGTHESHLIADDNKIKALKREVSRLLAICERIEKHEHCTEDGVNRDNVLFNGEGLLSRLGHIDGHRCAADIAAEARTGGEK